MRDRISIKKQGRRFLLSFANLSRSLFVSLFGLLINYLLVRYKGQAVLDSYVYCMTLINILMVFSNWGAKEYMVKTLGADPTLRKQILTNFFSSKLMVCLVLTVLILFLPLPGFQRWFLIAYLFTKSFASLVEPLVLSQKKFQAVLVIDLLLSLALVLVVFSDGNIHEPAIFLMEILAVEFIRSIALGLLFARHLHVGVNVKGGLQLLYNARFFFYTALAGFLCSRADQYVVAFLLERAELSRYYILMNLVILCQTGYTTFVSTFSSTIFRYNEKSFNRFMSYTSWLGFALSLASTIAIYFFCFYYYQLELDSISTGLIFLNVLAFSLVLLQVYHYTRLNLQKEIFKVIALASVFNVSSSFVLVSNWGLQGALLGNTLCAILTFLLFKWYSSRREKV